MGRRLIDLKTLNGDTYFREALDLVRSTKKGDHIALMTMAFEPSEPNILEMMQALTEACERGADVLLVVDAFAFMINHLTDLPTGPLYFGLDIHSGKSAYYRDKAKLLDRFKSAGGRYKIINVPQRRLSIPHGGRSHIRFTYINGTAYIGGSNLSHTSNLDLMVRIKSTVAADHVYKFIKNVAQRGSTQAAFQGHDREINLDGRTQLLIDSGKRGQSLILERALELIDSAEEWLVMTCQYFPNSTTARHLDAARTRGVQVRLFYNHPAHHARTLAHRLVILRERAQHGKELFALQGTKKQRRIHAKLIATEQGAIIGSHNYVTAGVRLGTAEAAILRRDSNFAQQAAAVIEQQLAVKVKK